MLLKKKYINIMRIANKLLFGAIVLCCVVFVSAVRNISIQHLMPSESTLIDAEQRVLGDIIDRQNKTKKIYAGKKRYFFNEKKEKVEQPLKRRTNKDSFLKNLIIVGIFWDEIPKVVLNDVKNKETLYMNQGDSINDSCTVSQIKRKSILIECDGIEHELIY